MEEPPSLIDLNRLHLSVSGEERLNHVEHLMVACSFVLPQVRETLDGSLDV